MVYVTAGQPKRDRQGSNFVNYKRLCTDFSSGHWFYAWAISVFNEGFMYGLHLGCNHEPSAWRRRQIVGIAARSKPHRAQLCTKWSGCAGIYISGPKWHIKPKEHERTAELLFTGLIYFWTYQMQQGLPINGGYKFHLTVFELKLLWEFYN